MSNRNHQNADKVHARGLPVPSTSRTVTVQEIPDMKLRHLLLTAAFAMTMPLLQAQTAPSKATTAANVAKANQANLLDINTASPDQISQLPGIGVAYTKRIIDGRPYAAKNQLVSRGIIPQKTYDGISSQIIAKHPAK
jgi:DNA uptake protein ComE-like DNA-binding protein